MMRCPACGNELGGMEVAGINVDVCRGGCGGIWFDNFELEKVDEPHEAAGEVLLDVERDESINVDHSARRKCPKCGDVVMMRHFFCTEREVEVDECPACAGVWLDCGELGGIRSQFDSQEQREEAAKKYFAKTITPELEKMKAEGEDKLRKARRITKALRYICPSYYIPGEQSWGAF
ncbi:MAG: zf-TFIIB domain-containing protein [Planctomycetota bacterium]|jgi:Zn-finger nucleic acid-binding protein